MIDERIDIQVVLLCTIPPFTLTYSTLFFFFFFNDTATTEIYTLSLHDALPISHWRLRMATLAGAASTSRAMAKLLGFQRCRPRYCSTYFEAIARSEEHTSELQSLAYLVCRLLLEKKKKKKINDR